MKQSSKPLTKNQSVVLQALQDSREPLSAYQIMERPEVRENGLRAPLTIYRALDKLTDRGLAHRLESMNAFVACCHDAPHASPATFMICGSCKQTIEVENSAIERHILAEAKKQSFEIESLHLEVSGRCGSCVSDNI